MDLPANKDLLTKKFVSILRAMFNAFCKGLNILTFNGDKNIILIESLLQ